MEHFSKTKYVTVTVLLIALFFISGVYVGDQNRPEIDKVLGISGKETQVATQTDFSPFWKVWNAINEKVLTVIAPLKDTPAYRANIKSGDKILKIDKTVSSGLGIEEAIRLIRGDKGTAE